MRTGSVVVFGLARKIPPIIATLSASFIIQSIDISYGRGLRQTVEGLRQARDNGAYCVGITNTLVSPIGQFAHESFLTSIETPSFGSSYVAPMALFNVIVVACANHRRSRTLTLMKQLEQEQRHGFRWYES